MGPKARQETTSQPYYLSSARGPIPGKQPPATPIPSAPGPPPHPSDLTTVSRIRPRSPQNRANGLRHPQSNRFGASQEPPELHFDLQNSPNGLRDLQNPPQTIKNYTKSIPRPSKNPAPMQARALFAAVKPVLVITCEETIRVKN